VLKASLNSDCKQLIAIASFTSVYFLASKRFSQDKSTFELLPFVQLLLSKTQTLKEGTASKCDCFILKVTKSLVWW